MIVKVIDQITIAVLFAQKPVAPTDVGHLGDIYAALFYPIYSIQLIKFSCNEPGINTFGACPFLFFIRFQNQKIKIQSSYKNFTQIKPNYQPDGILAIATPPFFLIVYYPGQ